MNKYALFEEIEKHIMGDEKPSIYLDGLLKKDELDEHPFTMLSDLADIEQNTKYHPEGSVWNHTLLVVDEAAKNRKKSENPRAFMWTALLHDIGKAPTTKIRKGRVNSYCHETVGKKMAIEFLREFNVDERLIECVSDLIRWHMEPLFMAKELPFSNAKGMLEDVSLDEIALLSLCDRMGRGDMSKEKIRDEEEGIRHFVEKCRKIRGNS